MIRYLSLSLKGDGVNEVQVAMGRQSDKDLNA